MRFLVITRRMATPGWKPNEDPTYYNLYYGDPPRKDPQENMQDPIADGHKS